MSQESLTRRLQETLAVFDQGGEPRTTTEIAGELDLGRRATYARLERLVDEGELRTKKVGANARVWWYPRVEADGRNGVTASGTTDASRWEQQFRSLVEATDEYAIFLLDEEGYVRTWNPGASQIKGYDAEEIVGRHFSAFYTEPDRAEKAPERNLRAAAEMGTVEDEGWRVREDGSLFWANVTITALRDDDGSLAGYAKVTRDMTERREREQRLREEKAFAESLLDTLPDILYAYDRNMNFIRWNDRLREVTGYTDAEIDQMEPFDFISEGVTEDIEAAIQRVLNEGARDTLEFSLVTADGEEIPYEFTGGPIREEDGTIVGVTGIGRDISDRKARERQLERQRDELETELEEMFERIDDAFLALDEEFRFEYLNDSAAAFFQRPESELLGRNIWNAFDIDDDPVIERFRTAMATQEPTSFERYSEVLGIWVHVNVYPSPTGLSIYFRDISERKERERKLEQYRTLTETASDVILAIDERSRIRSVNPAVEETFGYEPEELLGKPLTVLMPDWLTDDHRAGVARFFQTGERSFDWNDVEMTGLTADGTEIPLSVSFNECERDGKRYVATVIRDVSERKERERKLEQQERRFETLIDNFPNGAVALVDEDLRYTTFGGTLEGDTDLTRHDIEGGHLREVLPPQVAAAVMPGYEAALDGESTSFVESIDNSVYQFHFVPVRDETGDVFLAIGMSQDITERKAREAEFQDRIHQQEVVTELGTVALEDVDLDSLMAEAAERVADTLDNDYCRVLDLDTDTEELLLRQGVGWMDGIAGQATVSATENDSQAAYTLAVDGPVVVTDLDTETRFSGPDLLTNHDVRSGISTIIGPVENPWGILGTHDTEPKEFSVHDVNFVQSVANILSSAITRHDYEQRLLHQREQLAALNNLNDVVREITDAVIDQSTRDEIEATVCERLAASDSYEFAWIGEVDVSTQRVSVREEAGVNGYLDEVVISTDPEDERSQGPTGRAFLTGDVQVAHDISEADNYGPWREDAGEHGFRSSVSIPLRHDGTMYGTLNVYADRPGAFEGQELGVFEQLGDVVGHAIAATERKQTLMSDEVVELEFYVPGLFQELGIEAGVDGTISFDHVVSVSADEFLVYGTATPEAVEGVQALCDALHGWESVTVRKNDRETWFEFQLSEPPILSTIASVGGAVRSAVVEDGDYHMTVHASPTVDVRRIIDIVEDVYPAIQLRKRRRVTRSVEQPHEEGLLTEELTDRQRAALQTAFHAGFFEWPREVSGEDVAESLDIAPSTFHQHLRKAERRIFEQLLTSSVPVST